MKIVIGADHRGATAAKGLQEVLIGRGIDAVLAGTGDDAMCDYPERAYEVGSEVAEGRADAGILICGTGIGMSIAANKVNGVRAAVVHDELTAQLSKTHNSANVLCLSGDLLGQALMERIVEAWLNAEFEGGRHERRVQKIAMIESGKDPRKR